MTLNFLEILDKHNPHSIFMDKKRICDAMRECFDLGKQEGKKDFLSNDLNYLINEWNKLNQKSERNMSNEEIIDEMLHEAANLKLREEVIEAAKRLMDSNPKMEREEAIRHSLNNAKLHAGLIYKK